MEDASLAVKIDFMVSAVKEVIVFADIILNILTLSQSLKRSSFPYERLAIAEQKQSCEWTYQNVERNLVTGERTQSTNGAQKEA